MIADNYRKSFLALLVTVFLLPLIFVPAGILDLANTKAIFLTLVLLIAGGLSIFAIWKSQHASLPNTKILLALCALVAVYFVSALLATPSNLSLLGYNLEVGTFASLALGFVALLVSSMAVRDNTKVVKVIFTLIGSLSVLALFMIVRLISNGAWLSFGSFSGNMGNPLGSFADLGMVFALLSIICILVIGMMPVQKRLKMGLYALFVVSTLLLVVIGFSQAFLLALVASVLTFFYFKKIESDFLMSATEPAVKVPKVGNHQVMAIILAILSLAFYINPKLPSGVTLTESLSAKTQVANTEIRPTLDTTLSIAKSVLSGQVLFGSGPATFTRDWLLFKPVQINATPFWSIIFSSGFGFLPTQLSTTGIVGAAAWIVFFWLLVTLMLKALSNVPESRSTRFTLVASLAITLFMWVSMFFYTPSITLFILAFIFTGIFLSACVSAGVLSTIDHDLSRAPTKLVGKSALVLGSLVVIFFAWTGLNNALGSYHFGRAAVLLNTEGASIDTIGEELDKAVKFQPIDTYYRAISQINFSKAQAYATSATGTPETNRANFDQAVAKSLDASRQAILVNPASDVNWSGLGAIYTALVAEPLKVEGAYESAQSAYLESAKRNPTDPTIPLNLAQLEVNKGNNDNAKAYIQSALNLKSDFIDAYILLARIQYSLNDFQGVKTVLTRALQFDPQNQSIKQAIEDMNVKIATPPATTTPATKK